MPFVPFYELFPEKAESETKILIVPEGRKFPSGNYFLVESYCNELDDCRRVFINVIPNYSVPTILATISYGWDSEQFYEKWFPGMGEMLQQKSNHPYLEKSCMQSEYAEEFLIIFKEIIKDKEYIKKLTEHYRLFKDALKGKRRKKATPKRKTAKRPKRRQSPKRTKKR